MIRKIVNERIEELRVSRNMTQTEFAVALGMEEKRGRAAVNNWEQGLVQVKSDDLIRIAKTFSVSADYLLGITSAATDDKELQFVCDYTGLSADTVTTLRDVPNWCDTSFRLLDAFLNDYALHLTVSLTRIEEKTKTLQDAIESATNETFFDLAEKERDLELELFKYERLCRNVPDAFFSADRVLNESEKKRDAILISTDGGKE